MNKLLLILTTKLTRDEIQEKLGLKHRGHFISNYLSPAIERRLIQLLYPSTPNHPNQAYLLTPKGKRLLKKLIES